MLLKIAIERVPPETFPPLRVILLGSESLVRVISKPYLAPYAVPPVIVRLAVPFKQMPDPSDAEMFPPLMLADPPETKMPILLPSTTPLSRVNVPYTSMVWLLLEVIV